MPNEIRDFFFFAIRKPRMIEKKRTILLLLRNVTRYREIEDSVKNDNHLINRISY